MKKIYGMLIVLLAALLVITSCDPKTEPEECLHPVLKDVSAYFDAENHYPKTGVCKDCGETITREAITIGTADDFMQLGKDIDGKYDLVCYDVVLADDIDMTGKEWMSPFLDGSKAPFNGKTLVINGKGHTISHLTAGSEESATHQGLIGSTLSSVSLVIKNLTLNDAAFTNKDDGIISSVGGFVGNIQATTSVTLENCHLVSSHLNGGHYAGGLYGYGAAYSDENDGPVYTKINIKNSTVSDSTIESEGSTGSICGHAAGDKGTTVVILGSRITANEIMCTGSSNEKAGRLIGTIGAGNVTISETSIVGENPVSSNKTPIDRDYGRLAFAGTGSLTVDGDPVTSLE